MTTSSPAFPLTRAAYSASRLIAATPRSLFGDEIAESLRELISVLTSATYSLFDVEQFEQLFRTLGKIGGATNQLRGVLFEYMVVDISKRTFLGDVTMNPIFKVPEAEVDVDVLVVQPNQRVIAIECKGCSPRAITSGAVALTALSPCTGSIAMLSGSGLSLWLQVLRRHL